MGIFEDPLPVHSNHRLSLSEYIKAVFVTAFVLSFQLHLILNEMYTVVNIKLNCFNFRTKQVIQMPKLSASVLVFITSGIIKCLIHTVKERHALSACAALI